MSRLPVVAGVLPAKIVDRIKDGEHMIADAHSDITVLFADLVGFTAYAARNKPEEVVTALNEVFRLFDALAMTCGIEKIKTIGDAYMAVAGLPEPCDDHVERAARMALGMRAALAEVNRKNDLDFRLRIGLHSGPAVAGVIGTHKFAYDVWGDTVNTASRFESAGESGRIHISAAVADRLPEAFTVTGRGRIEIRDLGRVKAFFLEDTLK
jgi:adenylate cyclase